jgi:CBS domain-containing protein
MSKSKEGIDKNLNASDPNARRDVNEPNAEEFDRKLGARGQTDYTYGRESSRDFPRRSTSKRYRNEGFQQNATNPERANLYNQQQRTGFTQGARYDNRGAQREDTGDFYSRSLREPSRGSDFERSRRRGSELERNRQYDDPYRTYERGGQAYGNQSSNWQQNQQGYENQQWKQQRENRPSTTRDFGTPNYGSQDYEPQDRGSQNYDAQNYGTQNSGSQGYNPQQYNTERAYQNQQPYLREEEYERNQRQTAGYNRNDQNARGYEPFTAPYGFDLPYYDANAVGYDWQGRPYGGSETYRNVLRCRDIMTKDVTACSPESSIREVAEKMEDENVGSIPVVENGRLIGIVTDRDIVCRILAEGKNTRTTTAREAMTDDIVTCTPDELIMEVIRKMSEHQIRRIPICDPNGRLRGIISIGDIALEAERDRDIACALEKISEPTPYQAHRQ